MKNYIDKSAIALRIERRLAELNLSASAASLKAGLSRYAISNIQKNPESIPRGQTLLKLAVALQTTPEFLLAGEDAAAPELLAKRLVPVVGYVGAGAEIFSVDDHEKGGGLDEVEIPIPGMSLSSVAVRVRGGSMEPAYYDGDLIFYDKNDNGDLMHLIGKECVVSLKDGRKFIKRLKRRSNGDWFLHSYNAEPILDIVIDWAAKVKVIQRA